MTQKNIVIICLIVLNINTCFSQGVVNHNFHDAYDNINEYEVFKDIFEEIDNN
ncbi:hypothetical protein [Olleya sp. Bg11-27]|uniref:hypothetical protein n=1 Tax=Olleya sp. Bg11-27 TaxID=2058135 RepID=UPI0012FDAA7F|nr:hypothetical protein [Olleya sp. Bg11-27]